VLVSTTEAVYLVLASLATIAALLAAIRARGALALFSKGYRAQLAARPRLALFAVALAAFVFLAPLTGDPTWDAIDATFMSVGCYALAPWSCGVLFRARERSWTELVVALVLSLFVVSWSYDLYLVARDGVFPFTSGANLAASSLLYVGGGLFFSLGEHEERGLIFVFMDPRWPAWSGDRWTARVAGRAAVIATLLAAPIVVFMAWLVMTELGLWPS
jgi:hypothetical protein